MDYRDRYTEDFQDDSYFARQKKRRKAGFFSILWTIIKVFSVVVVSVIVLIVGSLYAFRQEIYNAALNFKDFGMEIMFNYGFDAPNLQAAVSAEDYSKLMESREFYRRHRYGKAARILEDVAIHQKENELRHVLLTLARLLRTNGREQMRLILGLNQELATNPNNQEAREQRIKLRGTMIVEQNLGFDEAEGEFLYDDLKFLAKKNDKYKEGLAVLFLNREEYDEALSLYQELLQGNPDNPKFLLGAAKASFGKDPSSSDVSIINRAIATNQDMPFELLHLRALVSSIQGNLDGANDDAKALLAMATSPAQIELAKRVKYLVENPSTEDSWLTEDDINKVISAEDVAEQYFVSLGGQLSDRGVSVHEKDRLGKMPIGEQM